jgi:hypothetical protein
MILLTLGLVSLFTLLLAAVPNRSNFPSKVVIPILAALLTKYVGGDWDVGFAWTPIDFVYWGSLFATSVGILTALDQ